MKFINRFLPQKERQIHFFGDSHMLGYEVDHDRVLGRNTYKEKKQWIEKYGLHKAILLWNQKMGRATKMSVYDYVQQRQPESYTMIGFPESKLTAWPAMMFDYMNLRMIDDWHKGFLNSGDLVVIGISRPTRTYKLDELGNFDYRFEDLDGHHQMMTDAQYAAEWSLSARAIMDFLENRSIDYKFISHFDIFDDSVEHIHNITFPKNAVYTQLFMDTHDEVMEKSVPKPFYEFGEENGFYHRDVQAHKEYAAYLKNYLT